MALIDDTDISEEEIAQQGLNALNDKYQKSVGFFAWDYFIALGKLIKSLWDKVIYVARCLTDLSYMEYDDLVNFVFQTRGIVAKTETYSSGVLTVTNGAGTINAGDMFKTASGISFVATETKSVSTNGTFNVQCTSAGSVGNVAVNSITVIPTTIQGIVSVTNNSAFSNGYDKETKTDLLQRYYDDIQTPITSGNVYHYKKWCLEVTGVGNVKIKSLWDGDNTVKCVIVNSNNGVPTTALINSVQKYVDPFGYQVTDGDEIGYVQNYNESSGSVDYVSSGTVIYKDFTLTEVLMTAESNEFYYVSSAKFGWGCGNGQAPVGAYCTIAGATAKNLTIVITGLVIQTGATKSTVLTNIENSIKKYLSEITFSESIHYVSYSKIGALIMDADGVADYTSYTLNGDSQNITLTDNNSTSEIPVLYSLTEST